MKDSSLSGPESTRFIHEIVFPELNNRTNFSVPKEAIPKDIQCKLCKAISTDLSEFNKHARQKHRCSYLCDVCSKVFDSKEDKANHLEKEHVKEFRCEFCSKMFWQQKILNGHIKDKHYNRKTDTLGVNVEFEFLNQLNVSSPQLKRTFFIHDIVKEEIKFKNTQKENEEKSGDESKEKTTATSAAIISPFATSTSPTGPMKCKLCEEIYEDNKTFNKHAKNSHGYRTLCKFCSQVFFDKPTLEFHYMIKHDKSVFCRECSKKFWEQKSYEEHCLDKHQKY
ncbi:14623_t:CDS:1 [Funneliformis geosporum]|uniref:1066_t:CDS:1 n=1 Tax=Funneliformis geosporum TaxID=1117311 RepID=A0A9W4SEG9_9GLOM|nr:14623_t:CDS:1 [Funneliformis geosporum]CAI2166658.1 1066_t:CDS:1 [Funneliformis geosporum]